MHYDIIAKLFGYLHYLFMRHRMNPASRIMGFIKKPAAHFILIVLLGIAAYSGTFHVPFVFDDRSSITDNPLVKDLGNFITRREAYPANEQRYIGYLTFALNYRFCGLDVKYYHAVNLAIHIINALLVYLLIVLTFRTDFLKKSSIAGSARWIALFASALFIVHPVQTQAVTYIVQRLTSLAVLFYLASLVFFIKARFSLRREGFNGLTATAFYLTSLIFALLAMKTKEMSFTLPFIAALYEFYFFDEKTRKRLLILFPMFITILIIPVSMAFAHESGGNILSDLNTAATISALPRWDYLLTQFSVILTYIRLLFLPVNQNLDYYYPITHSLLNPRAFGPLLMILCMLGAAALIFVRSRKAGDAAMRLVSFGILWFFVTLSVESSIIPIQDVIFEHRVYLPSVGFFMAMSCAFALTARKWFEGTRVPIYVAAAVVLTLLVAAYARNNVWASELSLWQDNVKKSPGKSRPYNELGMVLSKKGGYVPAKALFEKAIQLDPRYPEPYNCLGIVYKNQGQNDRARVLFERAVQLDPKFTEAYVNLGITLALQGEYDKARYPFEKAIKLDPYYFQSFNGLGMVILAQEDYAGAKALFEKAIKLNPKFEYSYNNLGIVLCKQGEYLEAKDLFEKAIQLNPAFDDAYLNLGKVYLLTGDYELSINMYRKALELNGRVYDTYYGLALAFIKTAHYQDAYEVFLKMAGIFPEQKDIRLVGADLLRKNGQKELAARLTAVKTN
jgi:protein O-mannosyl-transferase